MTSNVPPPSASEDAPTEPSPGPPQRGRDDAPWPIWTAPTGLALGFALGIFVTVFVGAFAQASGLSLSNPTPAVSLISSFLFDLAFVAAAVYFAGVRFGARPADFGFRRVRLDIAVAAVVTAGLVYYVLMALYATALKLNGHEKLPIPIGHSNAALAAATVFVCVIAPMAEEFFFRGFVFGALRHMRIKLAGRELGTSVAAAITGILFGLAHTGSAASQYLVPLGFLGFVLCLVRWRTGSLYPCMALHSLNNSLAMGIDQFHWNALEVVGLMAGSIALIGVITLPLGTRRRFS